MAGDTTKISLPFRIPINISRPPGEATCELSTEPKNHSKKYEFTGEEKTLECGTVVKRIRYLIDLPHVKAGEQGGWIEKESNLAHGGRCRVLDEATVWGGAAVEEDASVEGHSKVCDDSMVYDGALVCEFATISGDAHIYGFSIVCGYATVCGEAATSGSSIIKDSATVCDGAIVFGRAKVRENSVVTGDAMIGGNADISGYTVVATGSFLTDDHIVRVVE